MLLGRSDVVNQLPVDFIQVVVSQELIQPPELCKVLVMIRLALFHLAASDISVVCTDKPYGSAQPIQCFAVLPLVAIVFEIFVQAKTFLEVKRILCHDRYLCVFRDFHCSCPSRSLAEPQI